MHVHTAEAAPSTRTPAPVAAATCPRQQRLQAGIQLVPRFQPYKCIPENRRTVLEKASSKKGGNSSYRGRSSKTKNPLPDYSTSTVPNVDSTERLPRASQRSDFKVNMPFSPRCRHPVNQVSDGKRRPNVGCGLELFSRSTRTRHPGASPASSAPLSYWKSPELDGSWRNSSTWTTQSGGGLSKARRSSMTAVSCILVHPRPWHRQTDESRSSRSTRSSKRSRRHAQRQVFMVIR